MGPIRFAPFAAVLLPPRAAAFTSAGRDALLVAEAITNRGGFWERLLSHSWLVYIGKISYGLYLWHYPIFTEIQKHHWPPGKELGFEFALTAVAVLASYYFLERPLLALKDKLAGRGTN